MSAKPATRTNLTLMERAAAVPWWVWVGAAVVSHGVLRLVAAEQAGAALQYGVPALFIAAALLGQHLTRAPKAAPVRVDGGLDVSVMRWREFEGLIGRAFELQGFHMNEPGGAGSDASIDLLMRKERQTHLVHCKAWRADKVGVDTVRAVHAAMKARGAVGGFVLSAGRFSREAAASASGYNIRVVDGPALQALLLQGQAQAARSERGRGAAADTEPAALELPSAPASAWSAAATAAAASAVLPAELALPCPLCAGDMKRRLAKRGLNAGQYFWGCVRHPECRGTRRVRPG